MNRPKRARMFVIEALPSRDVPGGLGSHAVIDQWLLGAPVGAAAGGATKIPPVTSPYNPGPTVVPDKPPLFPYHTPNHVTNQ